MKIAAIYLPKPLAGTYKATWCHNPETKLNTVTAMRTSNLRQYMQLRVRINSITVN
jgi:hypothetical protein